MNSAEPRLGAPETFDAAGLLASLSEDPGVYRMLDAQGVVLYVGKAKHLKRRVASYFNRSGLSPRIQMMVRQIASVETTVTRSEAEALILENTLIKHLAPRYNILFRDDKSYPYIAFGAGAFPRLHYHRGSFEAGARYFGPFPSGLAARESIQLVQKVFWLRTCEDAVFAHRSRPCLMHQIQRCKAPCVGLITQDAYASDVRRAELFLRGRHVEVVEAMTVEMQAAAERLEFERAAGIRDQIRALQTVLHKQFVASARDSDVDIVAVAERDSGLCINLAMVRGGLHLGDRAFFPEMQGLADAGDALAAFMEQHYAMHPEPPRILLGFEFSMLQSEIVGLAQPHGEQERAWMEMAERNAELALRARTLQRSRSGQRLEALRQSLDLGEAPRRIECFDISHTMGEGTVASCVVCVDGQMRKSDYRRFNIEGVTPGDDYAAMAQALRRRYERVASGEAEAPDLILIDGGAGQHGVARDILADLGLGHLPSIGIAKGEERKVGCETLLLHGKNQPLQLAMDDPGFHLIQEIRDEAHRFALVGHRARRAKARSRSNLEDIEGIGPERRRRLLAHFGGMDGVRAATVGDLCRVPGISKRLAEQIHTALRGGD